MVALEGYKSAKDGKVQLFKWVLLNSFEVYMVFLLYNDWWLRKVFKSSPSKWNFLTNGKPEIIENCESDG